jgi:hypothetical protein
VTVTVSNPLISSVAASNVSSSGGTITWTTNEPSTSQVDYGLTTAYGTSTALTTTLVTSHSQPLRALAPSTLYHYRVKSKDSAGRVAVSGDFTFTTRAGSVSGLQNVVWIDVVNATVTANSLQKTSGCAGCDDAGGISQQQISSSNGYLEFTVSETAQLRYAGLSHAPTGTSAAGINFAIRLQSGNAEVRENGVYQADTPFAAGDVFRVAIESGVVKYYKNGTLFYTSRTAPVYPLQADTSLLDLSSTVTNAVISF